MSTSIALPPQKSGTHKSGSDSFQTVKPLNPQKPFSPNLRIDKMPYNLRPRNGGREIRVPRRGDRVTIFWSTLGEALSGRLTKYDRKHKTFLVVYDRTPRGFDDHRVWESLDVVPWRFDDGLRREFGTREGDGGGVGEEWFQPGELGNAHPEFRTDESEWDLESGSESESESGESELDRNDADSGSDADVEDDGHLHDGDDDEVLGVRNDDTERVERAHGIENNRQRQSDDEDREAGREILSSKVVRPSQERGETESLTRHQQEERREQRREKQLYEDPERDDESDGDFEGSLKDGLSLAPISSQHETPTEAASHLMKHLHDQTSTRARRRHKLRIGTSQRSGSDRENGSRISLHGQPQASTRQPHRRSKPQTVEHFEVQPVRREQKRKVQGTGDSDHNSENSFKDSLYHPPRGQGQQVKRRKPSQPAERLPKTHRTVQNEDDVSGRAFQDESEGQRHVNPQKGSPSGAENELVDSLYHPPLATHQESSRRGLHWQASSVGSSQGEHRRGWSESLDNQPFSSSDQVNTRKPRGLVQKLQMKRIRGAQHGISEPQRESDHIFGESLYGLPLAPQRKATVGTSSNPTVTYPQLTERERQQREQGLNSSEQRARQDTEDMFRDNSHLDLPASDQQHAIQQSASERKNSEPVDDPDNERGRQKGLTSTYELTHRDYRPTYASLRKPPRETSIHPTRIPTTQGANSQANRDPTRRRRYASFGPSGFSPSNRENNAGYKQTNNGVRFYPRDTVHINFSREMQQQSERRLSHQTNQDNFRVYTGHHVPHADFPSDEDRIKSITKSLGVTEDESLNDGRRP